MDLGSLNPGAALADFMNRIAADIGRVDPGVNVASQRYERAHEANLNVNVWFFPATQRDENLFVDLNVDHTGWKFTIEPAIENPHVARGPATDSPEDVLRRLQGLWTSFIDDGGLNRALARPYLDDDPRENAPPSLNPSDYAVARARFDVIRGDDLWFEDDRWFIFPLGKEKLVVRAEEAARSFEVTHTMANGETASWRFRSVESVALVGRLGATVIEFWP